MSSIVNVFKLDALYKPGDTQLHDTPFCRAIPPTMRQHMTAARFREVPFKGPMPRFVKLARPAGTHAWQIDAVIEPVLTAHRIFDTELLMKATTFDTALDLLDALQDDLASAPKLHSEIIREVVNAVPGLTDEPRAEVVAYGRAAGMYQSLIADSILGLHGRYIGYTITSGQFKRYT